MNGVRNIVAAARDCKSLGNMTAHDECVVQLRELGLDSGQIDQVLSDPATDPVKLLMANLESPTLSGR